jgi:2-dehydro-3-deoxyglucarate aldolase
MIRIYQRRLEIKEKLRDRKKVFAAWTSLGHSSITEIFTRSGFDFVGLDLEHTTISQEQSQRIIAACHSEGTLCLPRIASHNMEMVKRLLDSGADGIIIPLVSTTQEVDQIISWCKYPPLGKRSFGIARAQGYGFDFGEYVANWNESSIIIIQIESIQGVDNSDILLNYHDVDGVMIGPYDLSGSLGIPGKLDDPEVKKAENKVIEACVKYGKACGTHVVDANLENAETAFSRGYTFAVFSSDIFILWKWSETVNGIIKRLR